MEQPSSSKEWGMSCWENSRGQWESLMPLDVGMGSHSFEDVYGNFSNLSTLDTTDGWCYSPDPIFPSGSSLVPSIPCTSLDPSNFVEDNSKAFSMTEISGVTDSMGSSINCGDTDLFHQLESVFRFSIDSSDVHEPETNQNNVTNTGSCIISRPVGWSLDERMLRALALFKESSREGILAQVWVPMKHGNQYVLTTSEQPYLLDQMLTGFREISRMFTFSTEEKPGAVLGLPGRVFTSKIPEWTSNVSYYKKGEYLRVEHALGHDVRGSIAFPVFNFQSAMSCCAVLELVTNKEKPNFDMEMEVVCQALQAVDLRTTPTPRLLPQVFSSILKIIENTNPNLTNNQKSALAEITDVLRAVCHAHRLPLALTWIPCFYNTRADGSMTVNVRDTSIGPHEKCIICIEETACYVNDKTMQDFLSVCTNHYLEEGQGIVGKALQSNQPFFNPDVQAYHINEYPLVHHVRKFGLNAAVAIRLRSTNTGVDDYILELFLPVDMTGRTEQQLLLNSLSGTMQRICRSLRTVSNVDLVCSEHPKAGFPAEAVQKFTPISFEISKSRTLDSWSANEKLKLLMPLNDDVETNCSSDLTSGSHRLLEKKRSIAEKNVSLSVIQQYFSGSLKDAAKNIGVCPTTLKRICRQHGISRWPSRKINKVNRSLRKIQTVLDSVQGVEGGLKFDPSTGSFIAAGAPIKEFNGQSSFLLPEKKLCHRESPGINNSVSVPRPCFNGHSSSIKLEDGEFLMARDGILPSISIPKRTSDILQGELSSDSKSSSSLAADEMDTGGEADDGVVEGNHLSSSTGDSSSGSRTLHGSSSGSQSFDDQKDPKDKISCVDSGSKITVKVSYGEDMVRFKFDPSWGYFQLTEEVAKRFKLPSGSFELKYLDDEKEWVMLACDSDLQECIELMEDFGGRTVKFMVRDRPFAVISSTGSCCFLSGD